jgi:hypothetical protein
MKTNMKKTIIAMLCALFTTAMFAQLSTLPQNKIQWRIERIDDMTKEEMAARIAKGPQVDGTGSIIRFKVRMTIPNGVFLDIPSRPNNTVRWTNAGSLNFILKDRFGNEMSTFAASPSISAKHVHWDDFDTYYEGTMRGGLVSSTSNDQRDATFVGTTMASMQDITPANDIIFEFPVEMLKAEGFQLCFNPTAYNIPCAGLSVLGRCPNPEHLNVQFLNITAGILNAAIIGTAGADFMTGPIPITAPSYNPFHLNEFHCGGIFFPLGLELGFESNVA